MSTVLRPPLSLVAAGLAILIGMAGLVRGVIPQSAAGGARSQTSQSAPIVIGGAYVRESAGGTDAAGYFTVFNTSDHSDTLVSVVSGAGARASVRIESRGSLTTAPAGLTIPAHGTVALLPGRGLVMIEGLYGRLKPGQTVNFALNFANGSEVVVTAPVIAVAAPAPTAVAPK